MQEREQMTPPLQGRLAPFSDILPQDTYFSIGNGPACRMGAYMWVVAELPSFQQGGCGEAAQDRRGLWRALCTAEVLKNALPIHHPQREVLGHAPPREGRAWQLDPQQLPGKSNPGVTWINKKHFASLNITWLSSCSLSNTWISSQTFSFSTSLCLWLSALFFFFLISLLFFFSLFFEEQHPHPLILSFLQCLHVYSPYSTSPHLLSVFLHRLFPPSLSL